MDKNRNIIKLISKFKLDCSTKINNSEERNFHHGYEYVDLGLPSGTLWATMNVGAESETDKGLYFAWGETQGYVDSSIKKFGWCDYKWGSHADTLIKYSIRDNRYNLDLEDDAARFNMGGVWHMPNESQCDELIRWTKWKFLSHYNGNDVNGMLFTSKINGKTLFFPNSGYCNEAGCVCDGRNSSFIWASSVKEGDYVGKACLSIGNIRCDINGFPPFYGHSVRGVIGWTYKD